MATPLVLVAVALTGVVVALAVYRLSLYEDAYGLTLLRLAATAGAVWIGLAFLLLGMAAAGVAASRSWLPGAVGTAALVGLLSWNVVNPAALVARRDLGDLGGPTSTPSTSPAWGTTPFRRSSPA